MNIRKMLVVCLLALAPGLAVSTPLTIVAMPTDTTSGANELIRHNLFHAATGPGGTTGTVLAWFLLDTSQTSTWDPATGALDLHVNIYSDNTFTNFLGTGTATSTNLLGGGFNNSNSQNSIGQISWVFSGAFLTNTTMDFLNFFYGDDTLGNVANNYDAGTVTLWGADGTPTGVNGEFVNSALAVDMQFVVPEPAVILLMMIGLLGIAASTRKR